MAGLDQSQSDCSDTFPVITGHGGREPGQNRDKSASAPVVARGKVFYITFGFGLMFALLLFAAWAEEGVTVVGR